jgi:type IV pilus assembly protein PilM
MGTTNTYFYKDKPLFGLDIGFNSIKAMQIESHHGKPTVVGYGIIQFDPKAIENGVIKDYETIAKAVLDLFQNHLMGEINTRRVAVSVPAARTFSRILSLPKLDQKDLSEAVRTEAEQYIPVPIDDLYLDFMITEQTDKETRVLAVAVPKKVVDSYSTLMELLGLDVVVMETTTGATARLFRHTDAHDVPSVVIDFGAISSDISIYDKSLAVTGTIPGGGDDVTNAIANTLGVTHEEGHIIKVKYGLNVSKKQTEIRAALQPMLQQLVKEIKRMLRYYDQRASSHGHKIEQVVTHGGGSNVPGLSEYLIDTLRLPVRACDPWSQFDFHHIDKPSKTEQPVFVTVAGLALINPSEIFV